MRIPDSLAEQILKSKLSLSDDELRELHDQSRTNYRPLQDIILINGILSEDELARAYSEEIELPYIELNPSLVKQTHLNKLPERLAKTHHAVVFEIEPDNTLSVAVDDPSNIDTINFLKKALGGNIKIFLVTRSNMLDILDRYNRSQIKNYEFSLPGKFTENEIDAKAALHTFHTILEYAVSNRATDIHIEPRDNFVVVRYRIDGMLYEAHKLPLHGLNILVNTIKKLSSLDINENNVPQEGKLVVKDAKNNLLIHVLILPLLYGEKVHLKLVSEGHTIPELRQLGFWGSGLMTISRALAEANGLILVCGPVNSGKSTTLISMLERLNVPGVNISTIEEQVKYTLPHLNQLQLKSATRADYINALKAVLDHDCNVIMIDKLMDKKTLSIALDAAGSGHLVLSTLYSGSVVSSVERLGQMGTQPYQTATLTRVIVAQKLIRKLCSKCKVAYKPTKAQLESINKQFGIKEFGGIVKIHELEKTALKEGLGDSKNLKVGLSSSSRAIEKLYRKSDSGCSFCNHSGYKGRVNIYESLAFNEDDKKLFLENYLSKKTEATLIKQGFIPIKIDGLIKALRSYTSIDEIIRVLFI